MSYVKFATTIDKPIAGMPELDGLVGKRIEIIALEQPQTVPAAAATPVTTPTKRAGWAKGKIRLSDDFDEPLEEFKDYM